ncbi:MAG: hypothetical protein A2Z77_04380 [Chloroflexi bacterium RBG_13_51_36]|nr:MAG: hypothetical protein A2Z77_04380 [Chloroflexi bacterium RBG_13_51_36]
MREQLCPVCASTILGEAWEKDGVNYCCEACAAESEPCECGCCHPVEDGKEEDYINSIEYSLVVE